MSLAQVFVDGEVARAYRQRAPYPEETFAILETDDGEFPVPELLDVIKRHSELHANHVDHLAERLAALEATGRFVREGEGRTAPVPVRRSVEEYIEFLHSTSSLARVRLGDRAARFDVEVRDLFARHRMSFIERQVVGVVVWGRPVAR